MSNKNKNHKRQIKLPSRFSDHVVGNLSNYRDGVDSGKGYEDVGIIIRGEIV